jgi:hypothetical protein
MKIFSYVFLLEKEMRKREHGLPKKNLLKDLRSRRVYWLREGNLEQISLSQILTV